MTHFFFLRIINAEANRMMPHIHDTMALPMMPSDCVNPATKKVRKDTNATVRAYGNWEETWCTCLHSAPALAMMVVSEIGEIWSPHTAPAIQAEMEMMRSGSSVGNTAMQIGMRMPNVPHEVPVAKARKAATTKMMAGSSCCKPAALLATKPDTYSAAPSESVILFSVHAKVRMRMAGTMASNPLMRLLMASSNGNVLRTVNIATERMRAVSEPMTSPTEALLAAKESMKWW